MAENTRLSQFDSDEELERELEEALADINTTGRPASSLLQNYRAEQRIEESKPRRVINLPTANSGSISGSSGRVSGGDTSRPVSTLFTGKRMEQENPMPSEAVTSSPSQAVTSSATTTEQAPIVKPNVITSGDYAGMTKEEAINMELSQQSENPSAVLQRLRESTSNNIANLEKNRAKLVATKKVEIAAINAEHQSNEDKMITQQLDLRNQIAALQTKIAAIEEDIKNNRSACTDRVRETGSEHDDKIESIDVMLNGQKQMLGTIATPVGKSKKLTGSATIEN